MSNFSRQLLNGINRDTAVYRVFPEARALELFQARELVLVRPALWDDPFENFLLNAMLEFSNGERASLEAIRDPWYGQCWTSQTESDAMWRIYSHDKTGVRLASTVGKLWDAVCPLTDEWTPLEFYIGRVGYYSQAEILETFGKVTFEDLTLGGQTRDLAQTLLIKREAFAHEKEVRVLCYDARGRHTGKIAKFAIDPARLVDDVMLDPRLSDADVAAFTSTLRAAGYAGPIARSDLYQLPQLTIKAE